MQKSYEKEYVEAEQSNAWFIKRKELIYALLKKYDRKSKILEIGCGSGYILDYLQKHGFKGVQGVDSSKEFLKYYRNVRKSTKLAVEKEKYDIILLLDVLEHVKEEGALLRKIHAMLKPKGMLLTSVPAYMCMWSYHDELNQHYRRYTRTNLNAVLQKNKFSIKKSTYWNSIMLPAIFVFKKLQQTLKSKQSNIEATPSWFNNIYKVILGFENILIKIGIPLPFGLTAFTLAKKTY
jgi:ubiquinone/menaquinone biosynthesis C-methylase UbiE